MGRKVLNKRDITNLPDKKFKVIIIKMLNGFERTMDEEQKLLKKEKVPNKVTELRNRVTGKYTRRGSTSD